MEQSCSCPTFPKTWHFLLLLTKIILSSCLGTTTYIQSKISLIAFTVFAGLLHIKTLRPLFHDRFQIFLDAFAAKVPLGAYFVLEILELLGFCDAFIPYVAVIAISCTKSLLGSNKALLICLFMGILKGLAKLIVTGKDISHNLEGLCVTLFALSLLNKESPQGTEKNVKCDYATKSKVSDLEKYKEIVENIAIPIFYLNRALKPIWTNKLAEQMREKAGPNFLNRTVLVHGHMTLDKYISTLQDDSLVLAQPCVIRPQGTESQSFLTTASISYYDNILLCFSNTGPVANESTRDLPRAELAFRMLYSLCDNIKGSFYGSSRDLFAKKILLTHAESIQDFIRVMDGSFALSKSVFDLLGFMKELKGTMGMSIIVNIARTVPLQIFADYQRIMRTIIGLIRILVNGSSYSIINLNVIYITRSQEIEFEISEDTNKYMGRRLKDELQNILKNAIAPDEVGDLSNVALDLYIIAAAAQKIGTQIRLESSPDFGTRFSFAIKQPRKAVSARLLQPSTYGAGHRKSKTGRLSTFGQEALKRSKTRDEVYSASDPDEPTIDDIGGENEAHTPRLSPVIKKAGSSAVIVSPEKPATKARGGAKGAKGKWRKCASCVVKGNKEIKKVLIVDDSNINRFVMRELFEKLGYVVKEANNGLEATHIVVEDRFDCIFMDVNMPVMDGITSASKIREYERENISTKTPIIAVTAMNATEVIGKCYEAGMDEVLLRPLSLVVLKECIKKHIKE